MRGLEDAAPLLQPVDSVAAFAATPAEATPMSSLVTRLSGGDATAISTERGKKTRDNVSLHRGLGRNALGFLSSEMRIVLTIETPAGVLR